MGGYWYTGAAAVGCKPPITKDCSLLSRCRQREGFGTLATGRGLNGCDINHDQ